MRSRVGYRRFFIARAVSSAGSYMQIVAVTWYAYKITGSAASVGLLSTLPIGWLYVLVFAGAIPHSLNCPAGRSAVR